MTAEPVVLAVQEALRWMRQAWPAYSWGVASDPAAAARLYAAALRDVGDAGAIRRGVTAAIRSVPGRFPPPVAELLEFVRAERPERPPLVIPAVVTNRCRQCEAEGLELEVVVDERSGLASCVNGLHRSAWFVAGRHAA
jgi:hypothetical protein